MDIKYPSGDSSPALAQQTQAIEDRPHMKPGLPELVLNKLGFWNHPVLFMTFLLASPYLLFSPVCRQYCDTDSCRYYRNNISSRIAIIFSLLLMRWMYLGFLGGDIRSKSPSDAPSPGSPQ